MTELVLVRHGETDGESSIRLNGITDVGLSKLGRLQMQRAGRVLAAEPFDEVIVSPLSRSRQSAQLVCPSPRPRMVEEFREIDFGDWETLTWAEVRARDPEGYERCMQREIGFRFPGGDSREGFFERVSRAALRELDTDDGKKRLATLHKGVTKIIICALLRTPWDLHHPMPCDLGSIHRLTRSGGQWHLTLSNATEHLGPLHLPDSPPGPR